MKTKLSTFAVVGFFAQLLPIASSFGPERLIKAVLRFRVCEGVFE